MMKFRGSDVRLWCLRVILYSLPTLTTHQVQTGPGTSSLNKRSYASDHVHLFNPWFSVKKILLLALSTLMAKPPARQHSAKKFGQIAVTEAYYFRKAIWSSAIERRGSDFIL